MNKKNLYAEIAVYLLGGKPMTMKFRGTKKQKKVLSEVVCASRHLFLQLQSSAADLETIISITRDKKEKGIMYEQAFKTKWPF